MTVELMFRHLAALQIRMQIRSLSARSRAASELCLCLLAARFAQNGAMCALPPSEA